MALRRNTHGASSPRRQGQDWCVAAGKRVWFTATEAVFRWVGRAIRIGLPLGVWYLGNVGYKLYGLIYKEIASVKEATP